MNSAEAAMPQDSMNPFTHFGKYGLTGLVILGLFYLVFDNNKNTRRSLDKNTEVNYQMVGAMNSMAQAQRDNTIAIDKLREYTAFIEREERRHK